MITTFEMDSLEARLAELRPATESELAELACEEKRRRIRELRSMINAPKRILDWLDAVQDHDWLHTHWYAKLQSLIKLLEADEGATIGICGGSGRGKTTLGVELLLQATERLLTARYTSLYSMLSEFGDARREGRLMRALYSFGQVDLLVIDQCDKASSSVLDAGAFLEVVDRRHNRKRMTILIGNGTAQEFAAVLGESIHSRINATGGMVVCDWPRF